VLFAPGYWHEISRNAVPSEDTPSYDRENPAEEHCSFDELAKGLADDAISRG
jgi:hypothetical protein